MNTSVRFRPSCLSLMLTSAALIAWIPLALGAPAAAQDRSQTGVPELNAKRLNGETSKTKANQTETPPVDVLDRTEAGTASAASPVAPTQVGPGSATGTAGRSGDTDKPAAEGQRR